MHGATIRAGRLATQLLALAKAESVPDRGKPLRGRGPGGGGRATRHATGRRWRSNARSILALRLSPARTWGDPLLLPELLDNLIDNALRYTPAGGTVTVGTGMRDGMSYLSVEDTGPGIAAEEREKVFERFYRVAGTEGDGSGLGLAIVKEIVDRHGGTVSIGRARWRHGTRICVSFPRGVRTSRPALRSSASFSNPSATTARWPRRKRARGSC